MSPELLTAIEKFKADPEMRRFDTTEDVGGCWVTSHRFAWYLHEAGLPYTFRRWNNLIGWRTEFQHSVEVEGLVVDWIFRQYEPGADWPLVEPAEDYRRRFGDPLPICAVCGSTRHSADDCSGIVYDYMKADYMKAAVAELERAWAEAMGGLAG